MPHLRNHPSLIMSINNGICSVLGTDSAGETRIHIEELQQCDRSRGHLLLGSQPVDLSKNRDAEISTSLICNAQEVAPN